jgi:site-specific DNA-cytosine methylase
MPTSKKSYLEQNKTQDQKKAISHTHEQKKAISHTHEQKKAISHTHEQKKAISLFSGAGGDSLGLQKAGYTVVAFSEFSKSAIQTHLKEFPSCHLLTCPETASNDITKIPDSLFEYYSHSIDILFAGFPCFPKDTPILTKKGYKPIQTVTLDDKLLTHTGKFQKIVNIQRKEYTGRLFDIKLMYYPEMIKCTEEHPFYVRQKIRTWNENTQTYDFSFGDPVWKKATELTINDYCGIPINTNKNTPKVNMPNDNYTQSEKKPEFVLDKAEHWFTMGYFTVAGWIEKHVLDNPLICFVFNSNDTKSVSRIKSVLPIESQYSTGGNGLLYTCKDQLWYDVLKRFQNNFVPEWVHDAPTKYIQEFIGGCLIGLSSSQKIENRIVVTQSLEFVYDIQRLCLKLGSIIRVKKIIKTNNTYSYEIHFNFDNVNKDYAFIDGDYAWYKISRKEETILEKEETVYNFEVAEDNSYIVHNTIVHNCNGFTGKGEATKELVFEFARAAQVCKPKYIIGELIPNLISKKGKDPNSGKLRPVMDILRDIFVRAGYNIIYKVLKANEFGIPQDRRRLIIVGTPAEKGHPHINWITDTSFPKISTIRSILETHLDGAVEFPEENIPNTLSPHYWIITTEVKESGTPHPTLVNLVNGIRPKSSNGKGTPSAVGGGLLSFGYKKSSYHGQILDPDMPCKTINATYASKPRLFVGLHNPDEGKYWVRCLSIKELAQIQGFPKEYQWQGTDKEIIMQIGNAIPPALCEGIVRSLSSITYTNTSNPTNIVDIDEEDESE